MRIYAIDVANPSGVVHVRAEHVRTDTGNITRRENAPPGTGTDDGVVSADSIVIKRLGADSRIA